nr:Gfo/Idh/MocA family oxidoreductase [Halarchaeum acidiphilum]
MDETRRRRRTPRALRETPDARRARGPRRHRALRRPRRHAHGGVHVPLPPADRARPRPPRRHGRRRLRVRDVRLPPPRKPGRRPPRSRSRRWVTDGRRVLPRQRPADPRRDPDAVTATTFDSRDCGVDTRLAGTFEYAGGARATLRCWFDAPEHQRYRIETTDGWIEASPAFNVAADAPAELRYAVDGRTVTESFEPVDQYAREAEHFADCVESGMTPRTSGEDALANMRVIDALYEAAATGERVAP